MILVEICKIIKKCLGIMLCAALFFHIAGCGKEVAESEHSNKNELAPSEEANEVTELKLFFDDIEIPVIWEDNDTVKNLYDEAVNDDIVVEMSMYGGNEQVGSLGRSYPKKDSQTTTSAGDIVLYNGNQIVVFYGSNTWSYTRLGKMNLPEEEIVDLLSKGNITLTIKH